MNSPASASEEDLALAHLRTVARRDPELAAAAATTANGQDFLDWFSRYVVTATDADVVYVGTLVGAGGERIRTVTLRADDTASDTADDTAESDCEFALAGTPGAGALAARSITSGATSAYPDDGFASKREATDCVAMALTSPSARPLGVAVAYCGSALDADSCALIRGTFALFRSRIATVLGARQTRAELQNVLQASLQESGEENLVSLMQALSRAMRVKTAFVAELTDAEHGLAKSLALVVDGEPLPVMNFAIAGTPTEAVLADGSLFCEAGVGATYPDVAFLRELGAEGYLAVTLRCHHGKPIGFLGLIHDAPLDERFRDVALFQVCTARATAELLRLRAERQRLTLERTILDTQRAESLGLLASGVAHDFRNLLTSIEGNADLAADDLDLQDPLHGRLSAIKTAATRATRLCSQLQTYAGKGRMKRSVVDLNHLIDDIGELLGAAMPKRCALRFDLAANLPAIEGDVAQLQQVVMNLLTNATEAAPPSGCAVSVRTALAAPPTESIGHLVAPLGADAGGGEYVLIEVRDEGCGMTADVLERIFEPFFSTKTDGAGRGLGLAALAGIVRGHAGTIEVLSAPDEGTTVRVYIPASPLTAPPRGWPQHPRSHAAVTTKVLIADDEPTVRALAETMLVQAGFEVILATDGEQTLAAVDRHGDQIGCIVLDLVMPRMDGAQVIAALKRAESRIPIIVSSGFPQAFLAGQIADGDVAAMLSKPYTAADLVETVDSVLLGADT